MPSYDSTARVPFASGGRVGSKKPKVKRIILWKGKAKDWPGAKKAAERTKKAEGGWITKKKKTNPWITKKKRTDDAGETRPPNAWIQKKKKSWITKKKKPKAWITKKKKQGYDAREDESLGMRRGKESGKKQSFKDRRDESYGAWGKRSKFEPDQKINKWIQKRTDKAKGGRAKDSVNQPGTHSWWLLHRNKRDKKAEGGEVGLDDYKKSKLSKWAKKYGAKGLRPQAKAKGGKADKNWIQGVNKSIKKRGTKGVCTGKKFGSASCPPGSKRYNLAKTFKKMARAKHASGGLVRFI